MMHWFFFILFMIWTLALVWNGKDLYNNKKQWILTGGCSSWCYWRLLLLVFC